MCNVTCSRSYICMYVYINVTYNSGFVIISYKLYSWPKMSLSFPNVTFISVQYPIHNSNTVLNEIWLNYMIFFRSMCLGRVRSLIKESKWPILYFGKERNKKKDTPEMCGLNHHYFTYGYRGAFVYVAIKRTLHERK